MKKSVGRIYLLRSFFLGIIILILCSGSRLIREPEIFSLPFSDAFIQADESVSLYAISDDYFSDAQRTLDSPDDIDVDAAEGWRLYEASKQKKKTVTVAVIDTGVDYLHEDLADRMWVNQGEIPDNGIDDDNNGFIDDIYGWDFYNNDNTVCHYITDNEGNVHSDPGDCDDHGTHIAGVISASRDNKTGIAGIAGCADVRIMSLKIHGGTNQNGRLSDAVKAIQYAEMMGADICNISWGTDKYNEALYQAMVKSGMLFCVAAGNNGMDIDSSPVYPASFVLDNMITVTYVGRDGNLTNYSNYGKESVDVAVPAYEVFSTVVGGYKYMAGSSMAAPHVTGIAAVLYSLGVNDPKTVRQRIVANIRPIEGLEGYLNASGIANLKYALENKAGQKKPADEADNAVKENNGAGENKDSEDEIDSNSDYIITKSYDGDMLLITFKPVGEKKKLPQLRYLYGIRSLNYFKNGQGGLAIESDCLYLDKEGNYSFYSRDREGNERVRTYYISDDTLSPKIDNVGIKVSFDYKSLSITADVSDSQSGIKKVKILKGSHGISDFIGRDGTELTVKNGKVSYETDSQGTYTLYACDYRGNKTVKTVMCYIRKAKTISLEKTGKRLKVGGRYTLKPVLYPAMSTDAVKFSSSNKKVATVSRKGVITAKKKGKTVITVTAASGVKVKFKVTVVK